MPGLRSPFDWSWAVRTFAIVVGTILALLVLVHFGTLNTGGGWVAVRGPVPPENLSACAAELTSPDQRVRLHARDVLAYVAVECPQQAAEAVAPLVAAFLNSENVKVRASTIKMLGAIGPAAGKFVVEIEANRGSGIAHLDHMIDAALAGVRRPPPKASSGEAYCSLLSRETVELALSTPVEPDWTWASISEGNCATSPRRRR
jgi:hypothetical protein